MLVSGGFGARLSKVLAAFLILMMTVGAMPAFAQSESSQSGDRPGLVREGEYASPLFDTNITWTDAWEVGDPDNEYVAHAIGGYWDDAVGSDPDLGDALYLIDTDSASSVISISLSGNGLTIEQYREAMERPTFLEDNLFLEPGAEVLLFDSDDRESIGLLARDPAPDADHAVYFEVHVPSVSNEPVVAFAIDLFDSKAYETQLNSAEKNLMIEGFSLFEAVSLEEVLGAASTTSGTPQGNSSGSVDPDSYLKRLREEVSTRSEQIDRFYEIADLGTDATRSDNLELQEITEEWSALIPIEAPTGFDEIDDIYGGIVKNLTSAGSNLTILFGGGAEDAEEDELTSQIGGSISSARSLLGELDGLLEDEGF